MTGFVLALRAAAGSWEALGRLAGLSEKTPRRYARGHRPQTTREIEQLATAARLLRVAMPPNVLNLLKNSLPASTPASGVDGRESLLELTQALLRTQRDVAGLEARVTTLEDRVGNPRHAHEGAKRG